MGSSDLTRFPHGFLWGAATAAHQVEGNNTNSDWWAWEHSEPRRTELKRRGEDPALFLSGAATDHWNRYEADFDLLKDLNLNAYRFSVEWARVEPEEGRFDEAVLAHYRAMLEALRQRQIKPIVTLHHQTHPRWFSERYGWHHRKSPDLFARYAATVAGTLGDLIPWWITINEPIMILLRHGPTESHNPVRVVKSLRHMVEAHRQAYAAIHGAHQSRESHRPSVSVANVVQDWRMPRQLRPLRKLVRELDHYWLFDRLMAHLDYIGFNYYQSYRFSLKGMHQIGNGITTDMGWQVYPEGLAHIATELNRQYAKPLLVTENGIADAADTRRAFFIIEHLRALKRAMSRGANVLGYCYWSLLDNFEWEHGFAPRFGLVEVDYATQERRVRDSARIYAEIAKHNALPPEVESSI